MMSCSQESRPPKKEFEVKLSKAECLSRVGTGLEKYFEDRMSRAELVQFWDCTSDALKEFQRLTSGENGGDAYSPQALRRFLHEHFGSRHMISDSLLASIMDLKKVLVSGSSQTVAREELNRVQDLISEMKLFTLELQPHVKVIFGSPTLKVTDTEVDQAGRAVAKVAGRLGAWLDRFQEPYTFKQLEGFIKALADWMEQDTNARETARKLSKLIPSLGSAKRLLVGGKADRMEGPDWILLTKTLGQIGSIFLDFRHAFADDLNSGMIRGLVPKAADQLAEMLELAIQRRNGRGLPFSEWKDLFTHMEASQVLPEPFKVKALKPALEWIVERGLGNGKAANELNMSHVRQLRYHGSVWRQLLDRVNGQAVPQTPEWDEFEATLARTAPINWDSEGRLEHSRVGPPTWTQSNRGRMVWPFAILHWLKTAYVGAQPAMSEAEMTVAVSEILPMLQNFGWLTATKISVGKRLVREADLFLYPSNGDSLADLPEATHYLAFVASSFRIAQVWLKESEPLCKGQSAVCVRELATRSSARALEPLPQLRAAVLRDPPEKFINYMKLGEETILGKVVTGTIGSGDILQVMMLFQYVEVFLNLYDRDLTQTINLPESIEAFQKYGPTLSRLISGGSMPEEEVLAFYTFMMKFGETPYSKFGGGVAFVNWKLKRKDWAFEADRSVLLGILNQLSKL
jgi:hypothetical protein